MNEFFTSNHLSAYIDGELSPAEMAEIEKALQQSPPLRQEYERLLATVEFLKEHGPVEAPPGFHARVMARVAEEPVPGGFWRRLRGLFAAVPMETLAVAVAAVLVAIVIGQRMDPDPPAPAPLAEEKGETSQAASGEAPAQDEAMDVAASEAARLLDRATTPQVTKETPEPQVATYEPSTTRRVIPSGSEVGEALDRASTTPDEDGVAALELEGAGSGGAEALTGGTTTSTTALNPERIALKSTLAYSLKTDDPRAIRLLTGIAARHGAVLVDPNTGRNLDASTLLSSEESRRSVVVVIDPARIAGFTKDLGSMGAVTTTSAGVGDLVGATETMQVRIDLVFED